jgi:hypothetical protein
MTCAHPCGDSSACNGTCSRCSLPLQSARAIGCFHCCLQDVRLRVQPVESREVDSTLVAQENISLDYDEEPSDSIPADREQLLDEVNVNSHPCPTVDRAKRELADQIGVVTHYHDADVKIVSI